jgi:hypothetical protein
MAHPHDGTAPPEDAGPGERVAIEGHTGGEATTSVSSLRVPGFRARSWIFTRTLYALPVVLGLPLAAFACAELLPHGRDVASGIMLLWLLLWVMPTRGEIGAGGVALRWLWVRRFLSYAEVQDVTAYQRNYFIHYFESGLVFQVGGRTLLLPVRLKYSRLLRERDEAGANRVELLRELIRAEAAAFAGQQAIGVPPAAGS